MYDSQIFSRESDKKGNQQRENDLSSLIEDDENIQSSFIGLLTTSVFPWGMLSKYVPKRVNRVALKVGNLIQAMMFLIWVTYIHHKGNFIIMQFPKLYSPVYLETTENCSTYYLFNSTIFLNRDGTMECLCIETRRFTQNIQIEEMAKRSNFKQTQTGQSKN